MAAEKEFHMNQDGSSGPNVLNLTTHGDTFIGAAINAVLGSGVVDRSIYIDYDSNAALADLTQPSPTTFSVATGAQINHAPYAIANASICCSGGAHDDITYYQILSDANAMLSNAPAFQTGGALPNGTPPPTYSTNASSPNSANGGTGWGLEFAIPTSYLGLDTSEDSWNSATMSGFLAALKHQHPAWTWFDVKAALRQTASNWPKGYSHLQFGYGLIDWNAANGIATAGSARDTAGHVRGDRAVSLPSDPPRLRSCVFGRPQIPVAHRQKRAHHR
jgi:hypothetical protein